MESPSSTQKMARVSLKHFWSLQYGILSSNLHPRYPWSNLARKDVLNFIELKSIWSLWFRSNHLHFLSWLLQFSCCIKEHKFVSTLHESNLTNKKENHKHPAIQTLGCILARKTRRLSPHSLLILRIHCLCQFRTCCQSIEQSGSVSLKGRPPLWLPIHQDNG